MNPIEIDKRTSVFSRVSMNVTKYFDKDEVLWTHQKGAIEVIVKKTLQQSEEEKKPLVIVLPTGSGKSTVAVLAPYYLKSHRVLVVVPSIMILQQMKKSFGTDSDSTESVLSKRGAFGEMNENSRQEYLPNSYCLETRKDVKHPNILKYDITIVNIQKFDKESIAQIDESCFDLVIVDEAHHLPSATWQMVSDHFHSATKIYLTATPERQDGKKIYDNFEEPSYCYTFQQAIEDQVIRDVKFEFVETTKCLEKKLSTKLLQEHDLLVKNGIELKSKALIFTKLSIKNDLSEASDTFNKEWEKLGATHSESKKLNHRTQKSNLRSFENNSKPFVMFLKAQLLEGYDHSPITIVWFKKENITSFGKFLQIIGRSIRKNSILDKLITNATIFLPESGNFPHYVKKFEEFKSYDFTSIKSDISDNQICDIEIEKM
ncbi:type i restriction enzyme ecoki r protein [Anaeramoeba flamelloides]|uniref:Type i restriction enzyme ecoki r protein n=1 Tax=Anaeramoeba flamelloides TaxID=1746091 RepID=A0ABQ8Z002_9EUKA|nr:type i restriction enzyme ecoki r protein [Anaeramoeba flamelloides]